MKHFNTGVKAVPAVVLGTILLLSGIILATSSGIAMQEVKSGKKKMHAEAYAAFQKNCLSCHVSVADPEKPGRTRDEWLMVVEIMHGYGFELTPHESEVITDLLYDLRRGMEKEAG
jgi:hypothetical protein